MESSSFTIQGMILGLAIAAPVGPIGLLCIRRTLASGPVVGFATGLGAATADAFYGAVAAFGIAAVTDLLLGWQTAFAIVGGIVLLWLGINTARAPVDRQAATASARGILGAYASTVVLTAANPATILSFAAIFGGLGLGRTGNDSDAAMLVAGVFAGSALWWLLLSGGVGMARRQVGPRTMRWINRGSGLIFIAFGVAALAQPLLGIAQ